MQGAQQRQCRYPGTFEQSLHSLTGTHTLDARHLLQPSAPPTVAVRYALEQELLLRQHVH